MPHASGLIPLNQRTKEEADEVREKITGVKKKGGNTFNYIVAKGKYAKCARCELDCIYKESRVSISPNATCCCPDLRARSKKYGLPIGNLVDKSWIDGNIEELLEWYKNSLEMARDKFDETNHPRDWRKVVQMTNTLWNKMLEIRREVIPQRFDITSTNLNVNVGDKLAERVLKRVIQEKVIKEQGYVVLNEEKPDEKSKEELMIIKTKEPPKEEQQDESKSE